MIEPQSAIGLLLVFLAATLAASVLLSVAVLMLRKRLREIGPSAERHASLLALVLPPLLSLLLMLALAGNSLIGIDHCLHHPHHLHLCLRHGAAWADQGWAIASLLAAFTFIGVRAGHRVLRLRRSSVALRRMISVSEPLSEGVLIAPATRPFSFAGGIFRPRIVISSAAFEQLRPDERRAVIEHERAHVEQGDLITRLLLDLCALFGAPVLAHRLVSLWDSATERLCDRRAADRIGDPAPVASALVRMAKGAQVDLGFASFSSPNVAERVEALLAGEPDGEIGKRQLKRVAQIAILIAAAALMLTADPLHHALETILGAH